MRAGNKGEGPSPSYTCLMVFFFFCQKHKEAAGKQNSNHLPKANFNLNLNQIYFLSSLRISTRSGSRSAPLDARTSCRNAMPGVDDGTRFLLFYFKRRRISSDSPFSSSSFKGVDYFQWLRTRRSQPFSFWFQHRRSTHKL